MTSEDRDPSSVEPEEQGSRSSSSGATGSADGHAAEHEGGKAKKKHLPIWQETLLLLAIALVLAIVIKALFVQAFYIPSASMEPGLVKNDRILVEKVSYWFDGTPQRGDVVVFKDPGGWLNEEESAGPTNGVAKALSKIGLYPSGGHLVKRVIGVAGDTITCCDDRGRIAVNGHPLDEGEFIAPQQDCDGPEPATCHWSAGPVPAHHLFVL
ncbi:MAG TPA: signal peptidase I, partial [Nocardioidaceae bacterium]|nr:signal peptidase I [Nocardioidaceae bacterium]